MAKQLLSLGSFPNDNTGDTLRNGGDKINDNFNEIYSAIGNGSLLQISTSSAATNQVLRFNGTSFVASDYNTLTSSLDVNNNSIISSSNGNITIAPNGTGDVLLSAGSVTNTFDGTTGEIDFPTKISYKNEYTALGSAPAAATYPGYFFTVDGDDNPYVNINITSGGVGDVRAKLLTEYSSIGQLGDVDLTTNLPTNNQVLKWNGTNWVPGDDLAGVSSINTFASVSGDTGTTSADSQTDTLTIAGGTNIVTSISGDTVTIDFNGTIPTTFAAMTDTDLAGITQGDSLYWNGSDWVVTRSPITWWELSANGSTDYTFSGPGFTGSVNDPTIYVYRGFTYAFDNSVLGVAHPFRIQSTQGLSGTPYTTGQSGSGQSVLYWTVPMDAPSTLYYQCTQHALMNGTITVVG
ncbi:baseplate wedge subunit and tail pin [Synechococcus phage S-B64]|uniref:Baseplate wedge subunit and tail pin n=2 Tax=Shandvirus TaxID=2948904 RepID=A0A1Z1LWP9_9CAUD|nr:baseplate wedge tail fiber protein connector [Synechococcus phage S-H35]YP_010095239.1 baseplate wedge tail fiber protein connector [Synechococcus phage S-B64]ARW57084.1 baseplate wedge subunit and tail pin [Synechococcus phage S-H35]AWD90037.1 baseplate wedge subunit and tail pin [Synechococcus phage S-B64]